MHTDNASHPGSDAIVASAQARGVPVVSARQMLTGSTAATAPRSARSPGAANKLDFTIDRRGRARTACGRWCRPPRRSGTLTGVKRNGTPITTTTQTIKGVEYAFFDAAAGSYEATYAVDDTAPAISNVADAVHADGSATITWDTNEASDSRVDYGTDPAR